MTEALVSPPDELPDIKGQLVFKEKAVKADNPPLNVVLGIDSRKAMPSISDRYMHYQSAAVAENAVAKHERAAAIQRGVKDPREFLEKNPRVGKTILAMLEGVVSAVGERINAAMAETYLHMAALERRLIALEQKEETPLAYRGVWTEGEYEKNSAVTAQGSIFIAKRRTRAKPQNDASDGDWQLAVRRGRDGKDGKP